MAFQFPFFHPHSANLILRLDDFGCGVCCEYSVYDIATPQAKAFVYMWHLNSKIG